MAANFLTNFFASAAGSFLAGASKQYVKQDEVDKQEERRIAAEVRDQETWDKRFKKQQDAINARTSNEERKGKADRVEEMLGQLKAVGYTPAESEEIIAGKTFDLYYGIGRDGLKIGVTGSSLLQTHGGNVESVQATLAGSALTAPSFPSTNTKIRFNPTAVAALYDPLDETSISLSTQIDNNSNAQMLLLQKPDSQNYETNMAKLIEQETFILGQIGKVAEAKRDDTTGGAIAVTDVNTLENIYSKNYKIAAIRAGFRVDPETTFIEAFEGSEGRGFSSQLDALYNMEQSNYKTILGDLGADKFNAELQATIKGLERHAIDEYLETQKTVVDNTGETDPNATQTAQLETFLTMTDFKKAVIGDKRLKVGVPIIIPNPNGGLMLSIFTGVPNANAFPNAKDIDPISLPIRTFEYDPLNYGN